MIQRVPWLLAVVGLAIPMVGSGFIGWPFVVGWLVVLVLVYLFKPLREADRATRLVTGIAVVIALALLGTVGGWYLIPAVLAWLVLGLGTGNQSQNRAL
jgi:hypothetical protein